MLLSIFEGLLVCGALLWPFEDGRSTANCRNFARFVLVCQLDNEFITLLSSDHWKFTFPSIWRLILTDDLHDFAIGHFDLRDDLIDNQCDFFALRDHNILAFANDFNGDILAIED